MSTYRFEQPAGADFHAALRAAAGDAVLQPHKGTDYMEIGTVEEVVPATAEHDASMRVARGMIFEKETYIPLDAVVRRAGDTVLINVPKLVTGKMPWAARPARRAGGYSQGRPGSGVQGTTSPGVQAEERHSGSAGSAGAAGPGRRRRPSRTG